MKVLLIGGISQSLVNFRGPLLRVLRENGHDVFACSGDPVPRALSELARMGVNYTPIPMARTGMSPLQDIMTFAALYRLMRRITPDVVLAYTVKPVVWGGLAARLAGVPAIFSMITGLGYAFTPGIGVGRLVAKAFAAVLYKLALKGSRSVFFLNPDDIAELVNARRIPKEKCVLINGTGIDLEHYAPAALPCRPRFLMICRLLADKGVREFAEAARLLRTKYKDASFALAGPPDPNPAGVPLAEVRQWVRKGIIDYLGALNDVRPALAQCTVYVLPSYREGTPRTVLEAMSMGRPVITTNAPGCRETIRLPHGASLDKSSTDIICGENGFLVPVRNAFKLAEAMERFLKYPELVSQMGQKSREVAEEKYDVHKVNAVILKTMGLDGSC